MKKRIKKIFLTELYLIKKGKFTVSHCSTILSLLPSDPGEVQWELVVLSYLPDAKINFY